VAWFELECALLDSDDQILQDNMGNYERNFFIFVEFDDQSQSEMKKKVVFGRFSATFFYTIKHAKISTAVDKVFGLFFRLRAVWIRLNMRNCVVNYSSEHFDLSLEVRSAFFEEFDE